MTRFVSTSIALFCALALFACIAFIGCGRPEGNANANGNTALTSPTPSTVVDCQTAGHDAIMKAIYDALSNNKTYGPQEWQFNITENGKKVTIIGWSPDYVDITKLVTTTAMGCTVDAVNFVGKAPDLGANYRLIRACPTGYVPCGDICIPAGEYCMIRNDTPSTSPYSCTMIGTPPPSPDPVPTSNVNGGGNGNVNKPK